MSYEPLDFLRHILDEVDYLIEASSRVSVEEFLADETMRRAFVRSLEVIGEAAGKLPPEFRSSHPELEWRLMRDTRNKLIHEYFGVDYELVWDVVASHIPSLRNQVRTILDSEDGTDEP